MNKIPPVSKLDDGVYLINEFGVSNCYLVTGSESALLIDCGIGFTDILSAVRSVTDLPVILAATHGHVDHIGGAGNFEKLYIHFADTGFINRIQGTRLARKLFLLGTPAIKNGFKLRDVKKREHKTKWIPIEDGFVFDLGGREVTVHHTPGHSKGSIAFIDEKTKTVFSGDNVCDALWMQLPGRTSLEEWLPSAEWLYGMSKKYSVYWGHRVPLLESEYINQVICWGKEIISSQVKNTFFGKTKQYPEREDGIIYKTNTIHKRG